MNDREIRRYCRKVLRACDIQPPLRIDELCRRIGEQRGKPIRLIPWQLPVPGPFGLWMSRGHEDCIVFQEETTRVHQVHIILHEIGHILCEHIDDTGGDDVPDLGPEFPGDLTRRGLRRTCYDELRERQAEMVATIIQEWSSVVDYATPPVPTGSEAGPLYSALNSRRGWL
ncbi:hypothetical protein NDR87_15270 [Nocardia sp. CDC159]|uniref:IrrE N-terminal-like domain-containing protein n=1 Tax=Nocardia pulmonis TaxID=2951408 RepID=A0A9X2E9X1_9NOCA|nr:MULTISPECIES: hypothetical protein [Nocardia]MCM6775548.1 hypothetical protein [Nocardia pulmonis]MCM6787718.1 hypothetical protein [Nocardia sp. CDC159]